MHAKTSKETMQATWYLQKNPVVVVDPDVPLHYATFLCILSPNSMYAKVLQECNEISLSVKKRVRENGERDL